jgi:hypothetical protein
MPWEAQPRRLDSYWSSTRRAAAAELARFLDEADNVVPAFSELERAVKRMTPASGPIIFRSVPLAPTCPQLPQEQPPRPRWHQTVRFP